MARTSRNGAPAGASSSANSSNVHALDNLNLDDMFADGGDALFDGLDIDLGNMDEITEKTTTTTTTGAAHATTTTTTSAPAPAPAAAQPEQQPSQDTTKRTRRTKRKTKTPVFYDDEIDDPIPPPPPKKKKKSTSKGGSGTTTKNKRGGGGASNKNKASSSTTASDNAAVRSSSTTQKGGRTSSSTSTTAAASAASATMPPPARTAASSSSSSTVAAAGQFGGRAGQTTTKRANSSSLKNKKSSSSSSLQTTTAPKQGTVQRSSSNTMSNNSNNNVMAQIYASHPGLNQSPFCGLLPSNTLFYPFMPSLPAEPSLKHRKIFPIVDRIHTSFMSHLGTSSSSSSASTASAAASAAAAAAAAGNVIPTNESEPIFQLMQEAFKEDAKQQQQQQLENAAATEGSSASTSPTSTKARVIGNAVGSLRRTISLFDRHRLAADLMAVSALLKRQDDFLKQNAANMEAWIKSHFSQDDYAAVYSTTTTTTTTTTGGAEDDVNENINNNNNNKFAKGGTTKRKAITDSSVLASFSSPEIKVRIVCNGFKKEPTKPASLLARLPSFLFVAADQTTSTTTTKASRTKKRKLTATTTTTTSAGGVKLASSGAPSGSSLATTAAAAAAAATAAAAANVEMKKAAPVASAPTYAEMRPNRRKKHVEELIARSARDLEAKYLQKLNEQRQAIDRQQQELRKLVQDDEHKLAGAGAVIHTTGMWKWLVKSGHLKDISKSDIPWRLDGTVSPTTRSPPVDDELAENSFVRSLMPAEQHDDGGNDDDNNNNKSERPLLVERLQSLLVYEAAAAAADDDDQDDDCSDVDSDILYDDDGDDVCCGRRSVLDLSGLTIDERSFLHLRSAGLIDSLAPEQVKSDKEAGQSCNKTGALLRTQTEPSCEQKVEVGTDGEVRDIMHAMVADLDMVSDLNNRRAKYLETIAESYRLCQGDSTKKTEEASLIAKCQQLLKKTKETKGKNGKAKMTKNDANALPW